MGCIFRVIFFPIEIIVELIFEGWLSLMLWILPEKRMGKVAQTILKATVYIFSAILFVVFLLDILGAAFTEATVTDLWQMIFIPLGISLLQIIFGVIVRITARKK